MQRRTRGPVPEAAARPAPLSHTSRQGNAGQAVAQADPRPRSEARSRWFELSDLRNADAALAFTAMFFSATLFFDLIWAGPYAWLPYLVLWPLVYVAVAVTLFLRFGVEWVVWAIRRLPFLCFVLAMAVASTLWSPDPWRTFQSGAALTGTTLIALFVALRFSPRQMMQILAWVFAAIIAINLVVVLVTPEYGIMDYSRGFMPGAWKGATHNKNWLAALAALAALFFISGTLMQRITPVLGFGLSAASLLLLLMAQSATSLFAFLLGIAVLALFMVGKKLRVPTLLLAFLLFVATMMAAPFVLSDLSLVAEPLGRSSDLTKRTPIWADGFRLIASSPFLGHGKDVIWGLEDATWFSTLPTTRWATDAHNGYLQLAAELGMPAALAAIAFLFQVLWLAIDQVRRRLSGFAMFALACVVAGLTMNMAETQLFVRDELVWVVFMAVAAALIRLRTPAPAQRPASIPAKMSGQRPAGAPEGGGRRRRSRRSSRSAAAAVPARRGG